MKLTVCKKCNRCLGNYPEGRNWGLMFRLDEAHEHIRRHIGRTEVSMKEMIRYLKLVDV